MRKIFQAALLLVLATACAPEDSAIQGPLIPSPPWPLTEQLTQVTHDYGPLIVHAGASEIRLPPPWRAWFYPQKDPYFFRAVPGPSGADFIPPLAKYDFYARKQAR